VGLGRSRTTERRTDVGLWLRARPGGPPADLVVATITPISEVYGRRVAQAVESNDPARLAGRGRERRFGDQRKRYGISTESMTWMTPFEAWMSVVVIFEYQLRYAPLERTDG